MPQMPLLNMSIPADKRWTCQFYDFVEEEHRQMLLDHIILSPFLKGQATNPAIEGQVIEDVVNSGMSRPSDHYPVRVEI